jgi:hypothetical protein
MLAQSRRSELVRSAAGDIVNINNALSLLIAHKIY